MPLAAEVLYIVHDTIDPTVKRRESMLRRGGAHVAIAGFRRTSLRPNTVGESAVFDLGQTFDARLASRLMSIIGAIPKMVGIGSRLERPTTLIARNLESLLLAVVLMKTRGKHVVNIAYEVLDIHTSLLGSGFKSKVMRAVERSLMRFASHLIISSPAYKQFYFDPNGSPSLPVLVLENKVLRIGDQAGESGSFPRKMTTEGPICIGWSGLLRCRRSLLMLIELTTRQPGKFLVHICGKVREAAIPDFEELVSGNPDIIFHGEYKSPDDLVEIYSRLHYTWTIDYYEEGFNSNWLLPNRLYESCYFGVVPIALAATQTSRWLVERSCGLVLTPHELSDLAQAISTADHANLSLGISAIPNADLATRPEECVQLVHALIGRAENG